MKASDLLQAWWNIVRGYPPILSIEVTRECPLSCPGCYAYEADHLGSGNRLKHLHDYKGNELIEGILRLVDAYKPVHVSFVGGEPLMRHRELSVLLPKLAGRGIHTQVVTSAVRPLPQAWSSIPQLDIVVSIDGLQPEHDARRRPATYERIRRNIDGHRVTVHCTITRQMTGRPGYLRDFLQQWSREKTTKRIWLSLFTPQRGDEPPEMLPRGVRDAVIDELTVLQKEFRKLQTEPKVLDSFRNPPRNPGECVFARLTRTVSADLSSCVMPCQLGGDPDCSQCGCMASAGLAAVCTHELPLGITVGAILEASAGIGRWAAQLRRNGAVGQDWEPAESPPVTEGVQCISRGHEDRFHV